MKKWLSKFALSISKYSATCSAIILSALLSIGWIICYLWVNNPKINSLFDTLSNITTFWMLFIIQFSNTRDTAAIQLKLDELIRIHNKARNKLIKSEMLEEEEILGLAQEELEAKK